MSELFIRFMGFLCISESQFSRARFGGGGGGTSDGGDGSGGGCSCRGCRRHLRRHLMARCRVERSWGPLVINTNDQAVLSSPAPILHHLKWVAISRTVPVCPSAEGVSEISAFLLSVCEVHKATFANGFLLLCVSTVDVVQNGISISPIHLFAYTLSLSLSLLCRMSLVTLSEINLPPIAQ